MRGLSHAVQRPPRVRTGAMAHPSRQLVVGLTANTALPILPSHIPVGGLGGWSRFGGPGVLYVVWRASGSRRKILSTLSHAPRRTLACRVDCAAHYQPCRNRATNSPTRVEAGARHDSIPTLHRICRRNRRRHSDRRFREKWSGINPVDSLVSGGRKPRRQDSSIRSRRLQLGWQLHRYRWLPSFRYFHKPRHRRQCCGDLQRARSQ